MSKSKQKYVSERAIESRLQRMLEKVLDRSGGSVDTFNRRSILTDNRGLVVTLGNGQEFQLTIVESTR